MAAEPHHQHFYAAIRWSKSAVHILGSNPGSNPLIPKGRIIPLHHTTPQNSSSLSSISLNVVDNECYDIKFCIFQMCMLKSSPPR